MNQKGAEGDVQHLKMESQVENLWKSLNNAELTRVCVLNLDKLYPESAFDELLWHAHKKRAEIPSQLFLTRIPRNTSKNLYESLWLSSR